MMEGEREQNEERKMRQWVSEAERKKNQGGGKSSRKKKCRG